jgi:hypothetical protein
MTHVESGVTGAKRQTWRDISPRKLLREIIEDDPKGGEAAWRTAFLAAINKELDGVDLTGTYTEACVLYSLDNALLALMPQYETKGRRAAQKAKTATAVENAQTRSQAILLLHLIMPNGKPLGQCTGADCKRFGGWYAKLAELVPARKQVADVLNESKVRELWQASR